MKVIQRRMPNGNFLLEATATAKEVSRAFDQAQILFANKMGLQPEPGKTPAMVALDKLGIKNLDSVVATDALEYLWPYAIEERNLAPAYPPIPKPASPLNRGMEFKFQVEVAPKTKYELTSYEPLVLEAPSLKVDLSKVDEILDSLASNYMEYVTDDSIQRPVGKNDTILIKMATMRNGQPLPNLTFDSRPYETGQHYMPDTFDDNIIGMNVGETRSFTFDAPTLDAQGNPAIEKVETTVTILEFQQMRKPEVTDEWVRKFLPAYDSRAALVKDITDHETEEQTFAYNTNLQSLATEKIAERFEGKIPDEAFISMREGLRETLRNNLRQQGKSYDEYTAELGGEEQLNMMLLLEARQTLIQGFALDAVYRHFHLHYMDEDIDKMCRSMNPQNPAAIRQGMEQGGRAFALRESTERYIAAQYLVEHATIVEPTTNDEEN